MSHNSYFSIPIMEITITIAQRGRVRFNIRCEGIVNLLHLDIR